MQSIGRRCLAEAIGTFFLVLIGPGAVMVNDYSNGAITHPGIALSFAFVVLAMVYALGHVSGAHINPAVTLAFWSLGRFRRAEVLPYVVAQCLGAVAASGVLVFLIGPVGGIGATLPAITPGRALVVELILSFGLMLVIVAVATDQRVAPGFAGLAIGLTVGFGAMVGGPLTGASMNPARSLGPAVVGGLWASHWIYWLGPIGGMVLAARVYDYLRPVSASDAAPALGVEGPIAS